MDLVTLFAAAIDTVPSTVPAPPPDGGGGGAFAWWDDLVPVIAALVGAGLGFWASAHQSKKDRAHAENAAQRQAVADFLAEYGALVAEEAAADVYNTAYNRAFDFDNWKANSGRSLREHVHMLTEPLWRRFEAAHQALQLRLTDAEVAKAADDFRWQMTGIRAEALAIEAPSAAAYAAATVFSSDKGTGADTLYLVAKANLIGPRGRLTIRDRVDRFRWKRLQRKGGTATPAPAKRGGRWPSKRRDTPATDAGPNE